METRYTPTPPRLSNTCFSSTRYRVTYMRRVRNPPPTQFLMLGRIVETATAYFATEQRVNDLTGNSSHAHLPQTVGCEWGSNSLRAHRVLCRQADRGHRAKGAAVHRASQFAISVDAARRPSHLGLATRPRLSWCYCSRPCQDRHRLRCHQPRTWLAEGRGRVRASSRRERESERAYALSSRSEVTSRSSSSSPSSLLRSSSL